MGGLLTMVFSEIAANTNPLPTENSVTKLSVNDLNFVQKQQYDEEIANGKEVVDISQTKEGFIGFWCKDKIKVNIAHIFREKLYFMLLAQTIDG